MIRRALVALLLACTLAHAAASRAATSPDEILPDPALEARARALGKELRCLVCQNQSIDDSDAPLAKDLRRVVRERLVAGDSDAAIKRHLVERYGDFVLLEPPFKPATWLLWGGPLLVVLAGGALAAAFLRRRAVALAEPAELDPAEKRALEALLAGEPGDRSR
ncbi:MAG: cytochrome c-type biogenesis protein CcmH [Geminicoccaceae bacterium]|nr:cytochrome c-type biogenesis protein CcmH [Geminicoccaceae bacterium]MCX8101351.1 cytochrome c-type biogenesis protein CcmH [Geminicoccaceae bacterium]MDW8369432.1 cytochrome c-type biogenesis protein [Geminicoccaceae bacterium]